MERVKIKGFRNKFKNFGGQKMWPIKFLKIHTLTHNFLKKNWIPISWSLNAKKTYEDSVYAIGISLAYSDRF